MSAGEWQVFMLRCEKCLWWFALCSPRRPREGEWHCENCHHDNPSKPWMDEKASKTEVLARPNAPRSVAKEKALGEKRRCCGKPTAQVLA